MLILAIRLNNNRYMKRENFRMSNISARYICYIEDHPNVWTREDVDLISARQCCRSLVSDRAKANGSGIGVVLDTVRSIIVAAYEAAPTENYAGSLEAVAVALPIGEAMTRMVALVHDRHSKP
jgi:hypothetical protein